MRRGGLVSPRVFTILRKMAACVQVASAMRTDLEPDQQTVAATMLLGASPAMLRVREQIADAADSEAPVLLTGESGTGKDVAARLLHSLSRRRRREMVKINCPAIPQQLFESELFGYEAGAFTGARAAKPGKLEMANGGTLFLDEIGELDLTLQSKLLRALQDFRIVRLGGNQERSLDVRLICGTNRRLEQEIAGGNFRADLFYRINVLSIEMPPLRARTGDIAPLFRHFVELYGKEYGRRAEPVSPSAIQLLERHSWPGNLRELENLAKRYVVLGGEEHLLPALREPGDLGSLPWPEADLNTPLRIQTKRAMQMLERRIITNVLRAHRWNRRKTARSLDISYRALLYKIKDAGLPSIRTVKDRPARPEAPEARQAGPEEFDREAFALLEMDRDLDQELARDLDLDLDQDLARDVDQDLEQDVELDVEQGGGQ